MAQAHPLIQPATDQDERPTSVPGLNMRANEGSFDRFVQDRYRGLVQFLQPRTQSFQDAEDVAQESVIKLMRYRRAVPTSDWSRLLYRIAINTAHDMFRAARRRHAMEQAVGLEPEPDSHDCSPDLNAVREQTLARIREKLLELPPKCQRVCILKLTRDMTNAQIAQRCGISTKMVEKHLAKGLAMLCREVGNSSAGAFIAS